MNKIKFDIDLMKYMSLFEGLTNAKVKDCIAGEGRITFIVSENEIGKAIGKNGSNVKRLNKVLNRKIKIVEFNSDIVQFVKNLVFPLKTKEVLLEDKTIKIIPPDSQTRGLLIGRNAKNLRSFEGIIKRYFDIMELRVI
jgi:N utilization substance protein A